VLNRFEQKISESNILDRLGLNKKGFVLVTAHRAENVDNRCSLDHIIQALNYIADKYKVIFSVHPRTRGKLSGFDISKNIILSEPFGFFDFVKLEKEARLVISDSGTVQEECCIYGVPSLTIRRTTERQETVECGSNILVGVDSVSITTAFDSIRTVKGSWEPPADYLVKNVSDVVINILLGRA
jgi:UDP-N-acetylglucosamine 2-epimerase (non-hydrolysing)